MTNPPLHTLASHIEAMPDCANPDCEFHHPEILLDEGREDEYYRIAAQLKELQYPGIEDTSGGDPRAN